MKEGREESLDERALNKQADPGFAGVQWTYCHVQLKTLICFFNLTDSQPGHLDNTRNASPVPVNKTFD